MTQITPVRLGTLVLALLLHADGAGVVAQTLPASMRQPLLADGSGDCLWIAMVDGGRERGQLQYRAQVRMRDLPGGSWQDLGTLFDRPVALAHVQRDLAILLDDGSWKRLGSAFATGAKVPGTGEVLGWAFSPAGVLAIRGYEGGKLAYDRTQVAAGAGPSKRATTQVATTLGQGAVPPPGPTSRAASVPVLTTAPATRPAPPVLFCFQQGVWRALANLPRSYAGGAIKLAALGDQPVLIVQSQPAVLRAFLIAGDQWRDWGSVNNDSPVSQFRVLPTRASMTLWTLDHHGVMRLFSRDASQAWSGPRPLTLPAGVPSDAPRVLVSAGEELHLLILKEGKIWEQLYDFAGVARGGPAELPQPQVRGQASSPWLIQSLVLLVVVFVIFMGIRRRSTPPAA